ncbi:MAG: iduronate-2-sulfatase, partial [Chitinivibrionales bacterium]|nr:iduronate-2-sulfatase [Chitinivibrionales bacterium]
HNLLLMLALAGAAVAGEKVGEFSIPDVTPLTPAQTACLRTLCTTDSSAARIARQTREQALPLLDLAPAPLEVIHYEGLVNTDPRRIATVEKLRQMGDAALLMRFWQASGDTRARETLCSLTVAWAQTYRPTGNDVNENKFYPLLVAYLAFRDSISEGRRQVVDTWIGTMAPLHAKAVETSTHFTNRYSKHVRLLCIFGLILDREEWVAASRQAIRRFVTQSLRPDGTSLDLERRDALSYHQSALRPMIELARLAGTDGPALYAWESEAGGSISKSVAYVVPYALGEKVHKEWVNTTVGLDKRRAQAGLSYYQPGKLFDPQSSLRLMSAASYFDESLLKVVRHLTAGTEDRFPTWAVLVNEAARCGG